MFRQLSRRVTLAVMAAAVVFGQVIAPAPMAFAGSKPKKTDDSGTYQQVICNIQGNSGSWKAQIGGPSTEHEYPLYDENGDEVFGARSS